MYGLVRYVAGTKSDALNNIKTSVRHVLIVVRPSQDGATHAIDHRDPSEYFLSYQHRKARYKSFQFLKEGQRVKSEGTCRFR